MKKLLIALLALPTSSGAFCSEPSFYSSEPSFSAIEPSAPSSYSRPDAPFCLSDYSYTGTHSCGEWELNNYFNEVDNYINELNDYIEDANRFAADAIAYAIEAREFAESVSYFADEIYSYANCEADDVKSQHQ